VEILSSPRLLFTAANIYGWKRVFYALSSNVAVSCPFAGRIPFIIYVRLLYSGGPDYTRWFGMDPLRFRLCFPHLVVHRCAVSFAMLLLCRHQCHRRLLNLHVITCIFWSRTLSIICSSRPFPHSPFVNFWLGAPTDSLLNPIRLQII